MSSFFGDFKAILLRKTSNIQFLKGILKPYFFSIFHSEYIVFKETVIISPLSIIGLMAYIFAYNSGNLAVIPEIKAVSDLDILFI